MDGVDIERRANIDFHTASKNNFKNPLQPTHFNPFQSSHLNQVTQSYTSEWVDSPIASPSKGINNDMSITATSISQKLETPSKQSIGLSFITPVSEGKNTGTLRHEKSRSATPLKEHNVEDVSQWDIFRAMLGTITGKDKMAKVGQYVLRLLLHHADKTQTALSDNSINIDIINVRYNDNAKKLNLVRNFLKHPSNFLKVVIILVCSLFQQRLSGMAKGLSTYRQFLRFGNSPFRLRGILSTLSKNFNSKSMTFQTTAFANQNFLSDIISFYYGINDEALLLYKLNLYKSKSVHKFVSRHESLAWYYDSLLGIYKANENIKKFTKQEMDLKINIQVKNRARSLSKQILGANSSHFAEYDHPSDRDDLKTLRDIQFEKSNAYIDLFKWLSDIAFNTYTVFNMVLPIESFQILMGISASSLSTFKIYRQTKKKLIEQRIDRKE